MAINSPSHAGISAAISPNISVAAHTTGNITTTGIKVSDDTILSLAKPNLYQSSTILDNLVMDGAKPEDEQALKDRVKSKLRDMMTDNLVSKLAYTRLDNLTENTTTITARCYVFTKQQLLDYTREILDKR
jgi:hypothetical protein